MNSTISQFVLRLYPVGRKNLLVNIFKSIVFILISSSVLSQSWEQTANFPGNERDDGTYFFIDNKYYCGLGRDLGFACTRDFFVFDATLEMWSAGISMPIGEERQYSVGCSWENKGYIFGGAKCDGTFLNDLWVFDPLSGLWTEATAMPSNGRAGSVHFIIQDTLYIVGGRNDSGILSEVWGYDFTSGIWSQKTDYPNNGIWRGVSYCWNDIGYAGMGKNNLNSQSEFNTSIYSFDPILQNWTIVPDFGLTPRFYIGSAQKDSLVFFFGGVDPGNVYLNSFDRLNISTWQLTPLPDFVSDSRRGSICFINDETFYTTTGVTETQRLNETWKIGGVLNINTIDVPKISIYPNPASEKITINFGHILTDEIMLFSLDGKISKQYSISNSACKELDLHDLEEGVYILRSSSFAQLFQIIR